MVDGIQNCSNCRYCSCALFCVSVYVTDLHGAYLDTTVIMGNLMNPFLLVIVKPIPHNNVMIDSVYS
jgi:hypothetical protein